MVKVRALYHFLDTVACKNRLQGEEFVVSEERAAALLESGAVVPVNKTEKNEKAKETPKKKGR